MAESWLSIQGLYQYDPTIFDDVSFPGTMPKQLIIDKIVMDNAELPLVYTRPDFMRTMLRTWALVQQNTFRRIWEALTEDYNPLHNYDRHEEWDDSGDATTGVVGYNDPAFTDANRVESATKRRGHAYGNIGVTTSAQMLAEEIDVRTTHNYAQIISDMFRAEFCVMVY
jgi:hypothetical protein